MVKEIKLRNARKVFPDKITRIRPHDFILIAEKKVKHLNLKEINKLKNLPKEFREKGGDLDILAIRKGKKIKFETF